MTMFFGMPLSRQQRTSVVIGISPLFKSCEVFGSARFRMQRAWTPRETVSLRARAGHLIDETWRWVLAILATLEPAAAGRSRRKVWMWLKLLSNHEAAFRGEMPL